MVISVPLTVYEVDDSGGGDGQWHHTWPSVRSAADDLKYPRLKNMFSKDSVFLREFQIEGESEPRFLFFKSGRHAKLSRTDVSSLSPHKTSVQKNPVRRLSELPWRAPRQTDDSTGAKPIADSSTASTTGMRIVQSYLPVWLHVFDEKGHVKSMRYPTMRHFDSEPWITDKLIHPFTESDKTPKSGDIFWSRKGYEEPHWMKEINPRILMTAADAGRNNLPSNGQFTEEQKRELEQQLKKADKKGESLALTLFHPLSWFPQAPTQPKSPSERSVPGLPTTTSDSDDDLSQTERAEILNEFMEGVLEHQVQKLDGTETFDDFVFRISR